MSPPPFPYFSGLGLSISNLPLILNFFFWCCSYFLVLRLRTSDLIIDGGSGSGLTCVSVFESPSPDVMPGDQRFPVIGGKKEGGLDSCSSSSSSIGKNSDDDSGETEVQSAYKRPFVCVDALEEALPIRRGISSFYNGKSKSFASLADAAPSYNIKHITKPGNAYTRKRRNLLAYNHAYDKNRNFPPTSNGGGISKRLPPPPPPAANLSRNALALAVVAMSCSSESISTSSDDSTLRSPPPQHHLPPLHPQTRPSFNFSTSSRRNFSPWRSFSLADLRQCATVATTNTNHSSTCNNNDYPTKLT